MTQLKSVFDDVSDKVFSVPERHLRNGLLGPLVYERGTRSFGNRMLKAGYRSFEDIDGVSVKKILEDVPTTRCNFDKVAAYLNFGGIKLI